MEWNAAAGDWHRMKRSIQRRWVLLADADLDDLGGLDGVAGQRGLLIGRLRELYGFTAETAEAELRDWERHQEPILFAGPAPRRPS
jgi:hypothetical protein